MIREIISTYSGAFLPIIGMVLAAFLLPIGILITRDNVKMRRQDIIRDLERFFRQESALGPSIIPSFEFVKTKYYVGDDNNHSDREIPIRWYSIPVLIFSGLSAICFMTATVLVVSPVSGKSGFLLVSDMIPRSLFLLGGVDKAEAGTDNYFLTVLTVAIFAFFGAYIVAIKNFIRSVANFDLSPITFFRASYGIIVAIVIAVALWRSIPSSFGNAFEAVVGVGGSSPAWFAAAFVVGFVPGLAERFVMTLWRRGNIKRMDERAVERTKTIPLELIDGIDADIRARLEDFNLFDVQNLATANPIMLFVETPYGIYQSIDWVAQAQLASAVGVGKYLQLREVSLRTIFDLERVFFDHEACDSPALMARVAEIILPAGAGQPASGTPLASRIAEARALASLMIDDLAVIRLRQIWMTVEGNLKDYRRLNPHLGGQAVLNLVSNRRV
jgi:hypothetical protein